ncbi:MAG: two-component system, OmpR family, response regulator MprA, partial [Streptomyces sp.]|nr:two-component system, OmpR family, response regulator MprA [Streptomyces sp.]
MSIAAVSTTTFEYPVRPLRPPLISEVTDTMSPGDSGEAPARILIVDDEPAVREALRRTLAFEGYDTELAADGVAALERTESYHPDAIVLDVLMPRMDGLTTARRLRSTGVTTPILMLTARDTVGDRVTGLDAGADDYLVKPFALEELLARLRALLRHCAPASRREPLRHADLLLDPVTREVARNGRPIA